MLVTICDRIRNLSAGLLPGVLLPQIACLRRAGARHLRLCTATGRNEHPKLAKELDEIPEAGRNAA